MTALVVAVVAAYGVFLVFTGTAMGWSGLGPGPASLTATPWPRRLRHRMTEAGIEDAELTQLAGLAALLAAVAAAATFAVFGGVAPALAAAAFAGCAPVGMHRSRRQQARAEARDAWPRMIEEIRLLTGAAGRSVPQALFEAGRRAPEAMQPAFRAAEREWLVSTNFSRTVAALKRGLADPTADATLETLLVSQLVGGNDLDRRLAALVEDRIQDVQGRKDARAKQAGVRFARRFVLLVPAGMALAGQSIGTGRAAYQSALGQAIVAVGIVTVVACWLWAGRLLRLPEEDRVFR